MSWRFTILNNRTSIATPIKEPVGWDKNKIKIARDAEWHGLFFSTQGESAAGSVFAFHGDGEKVLKAEYDAYGVEGNMSLVTEEDCGQGFEIFEVSKFVFRDYDHISSIDNFVKIPLEQMADIMQIRNRFDQKVNLQSLVAFDETTVMPSYGKLSFPLLLPSKGIFIQDELTNDVEFSTPVYGVPRNNNPGTGESDHNSQYGMIEMGFDNQRSAEIGNAGSNSQAIYDCVLTSAGYLGCASLDRFNMSGFPFITIPISPLEITPFVNFQEGTNNYDAIDNPCNLEILSNGRIEVLNGTVNHIYFVVAVLPFGNVGNVDSDYIYLSQVLIYSVPGPGLGPGNTISLNSSYSNPNFNLQKGDRIYSFYTIYHRRQNSSITAGGDGFKMTFDAGNYFKLTNLSHTPATFSNVFAINETISRIVEAITNGKVRGYSEYFGRTDSEPYSHIADGCGGLAAITDGLRVRRQENKTPGQTSVFAQSLKDIFEGLNPIHNIGAGIETDLNRPGGFNVFRVEPWSYFYNNTVILICRNVKSIERKVYEKEIFSGLKNGYQKWEAEQYNGLDEFLTKRGFRTTLSQVNNILVKYSSFVASGYSWEVTRRIGNNDSKDWRYDKETFIVCLNRTRKFHVFFDAAGNKMTFQTDTDGSEFLGPGTITISGSLFNNGTRTIFVVGILTVPGQPVTVEIGFTGGATIDEESYEVTFDIVSPAGLFVELGNIVNANNIIEPATIYNYRISPIRNAMRWMNKLLMSYRQFNTASKIIFTDGDGNYFAEGELASAVCKLENAVIAENATISGANFANPAKAKPFLLPERVVFEFPFNSCDYKAIKANPGGQIYFENECDKGYGHIDEISYRPAEQMANFILKPADNSTVCFPVGIAAFEPMPDAVEGEAYSYSINLTGTAPFSFSGPTIKPAWMTITITGNIVSMTGTPSATETGLEINFYLSNCSVGAYRFGDYIDVLAALGDIEFTCAGGSIDPIPFGVAGTYNWDMNITTVTAGRVHIIAHNNQVGTLHGFAIYYEGDMIIAPGQTMVIIPLQYDGGGINTFTNLTVTVDDTSGTSGCPDFLISYD